MKTKITKTKMIILMSLLLMGWLILKILIPSEVERNNKALQESILSVRDDIVFLQDIVPFEWDKVYFFRRI